MKNIIKGLFYYPPHTEKHRAVLNMQMKRGGGKTQCSWCPTTTSLHLQQDCTFTHNINGSAAVTCCQGELLHPEKLLHLQAFSTAKELLRQKKNEDIYSVVQRTPGCEEMGQKHQACFLQFLWKGRWSTGVGQKWAPKSGPEILPMSVHHTGAAFNTEEGSCPVGFLSMATPGVCCQVRGQALTLKRMSVHIAFPWVIIGSWSSPLPSQQSSSTHLKIQDK